MKHKKTFNSYLENTHAIHIDNEKDFKNQLCITFSNNLNKYMKELKISVTNITNILKISRQAVYNWKYGHNLPDENHLEKLKNIFNLDSVDKLLPVKYLKKLDNFNNGDGLFFFYFNDEEKEENNIEKVNNYFSLPTLINLSAGSPDELLESDEIVWIPKKEFYHRRKNLIAAKVNGDSMNKVFPDGSIVVLEKVEQLKNGDIGAFLIDEQHEATIKRFRTIGNAVILSPETTNNSYHDIYLDLEEHSIKIIGKLIYYILPGDVSF